MYKIYYLLSVLPKLEKSLLDPSMFMHNIYLIFYKLWNNQLMWRKARAPFTPLLDWKYLYDKKFFNIIDFDP